MKNCNEEKTKGIIVSNQDIEIQIYSLQLARGKLNQIIDETNSNRNMDKTSLKRIHELNKTLIDIFDEF